MLQLMIDYVPAEDRLLLRIGLGDEEAQFWLTRKAVKGLWPVLGEASLQLVPGTGWSGPARLEASEMQRQAAVQQLDFATQYSAQRKPVWGDSPVLATGVEIIAQAGALALRLHGANGRYTELPLDARLHAGLSELLRKAVAQSDWDMSLDMRTADHAATPGTVH